MLLLVQVGPYKNVDSFDDLQIFFNYERVTVSREYNLKIYYNNKYFLNRLHFTIDMDDYITIIGCISRLFKIVKS